MLRHFWVAVYWLNIKFKELKSTSLKMWYFLNCIRELSQQWEGLILGCVPVVGSKVWLGVAKLPGVNNLTASFSSVSCHAVIGHLPKQVSKSLRCFPEQFETIKINYTVTELSSPAWRWSPPCRFYSWSCSMWQDRAKLRSRTLSWIWPTASGASFPASAAQQTTAASSTQWCLTQGALGHASTSTRSSRVYQVMLGRAGHWSLITLTYFCLLVYLFMYFISYQYAGGETFQTAAMSYCINMHCETVKKEELKFPWLSLYPHSLSHLNTSKYSPQET